jgi:transcriptional regulator with XRE-family HTH domain
MPRYRDADLVKAIGQRVAKARRDRGFTQEQLSEAVGIEAVTLSRLETGHRALSLTTLFRIATALGVDLGDLLDTGRELPRTDNTPEEQELLRMFGAMSTGSREAVLRVARELVGGAKPE